MQDGQVWIPCSRIIACALDSGCSMPVECGVVIMNFWMVGVAFDMVSAQRTRRATREPHSRAGLRLPRAPRAHSVRPRAGRSSVCLTCKA